MFIIWLPYRKQCPSSKDSCRKMSARGLDVSRYKYILFVLFFSWHFEKFKWIFNCVIWMSWTPRHMYRRPAFLVLWIIQILRVTQIIHNYVVHAFTQCVPAGHVHTSLQIHNQHIHIRNVSYRLLFLGTWRRRKHKTSPVLPGCEVERAGGAQSQAAFQA